MIVRNGLSRGWIAILCRYRRLWTHRMGKPAKWSLTDSTPRARLWSTSVRSCQRFQGEQMKSSHSYYPLLPVPGHELAVEDAFRDLRVPPTSTNPISCGSEPDLGASRGVGYRHFFQKSTQRIRHATTNLQEISDAQTVLEHPPDRMRGPSSRWVEPSGLGKSRFCR
jgi:hypothetical protein